ncbi:DivIVA domain-containing protein, partial [Nostoc sp. CHAB 5836]|nr:DivIVA domain-containing protein [Nostoc sp. CHAB 5836]
VDARQLQELAEALSEVQLRLISVSTSRRQTAIAQAQEIEDGADVYADGILGNIQQDLKEMLRIVTNGRQQLQIDNLTQRNSPPGKKK